MVRRCLTESERESAREAWYDEQIHMSDDVVRSESAGSCDDPVLEALRQLREAGCLE